MSLFLVFLSLWPGVLIVFKVSMFWHLTGAPSRPDTGNGQISPFFLFLMISLPKVQQQPNLFTILHLDVRTVKFILKIL